MPWWILLIGAIHLKNSKEFNATCSSTESYTFSLLILQTNLKVEHKYLDSQILGLKRLLSGYKYFFFFY